MGCSNVPEVLEHELHASNSTNLIFDLLASRGGESSTRFIGCSFIDNGAFHFFVL
jgi:hypothetical protein